MSTEVDYNDGLWHGWNGGECPVHPESKVEVAFSTGAIDDSEEAGDWYWEVAQEQIIAFRVTKPYVEPKMIDCEEVVIVFNEIGNFDNCYYRSEDVRSWKEKAKQYAVEMGGTYVIIPAAKREVTT